MSVGIAVILAAGVIALGLLFHGARAERERFRQHLKSEEGRRREEAARAAEAEAERGRSRLELEDRRAKQPSTKEIDQTIEKVRRRPR